MNTTILETKRMLFRELTTEDIPSIYEIVSDVETMKHYPAPYDMDGATEWVHRNLNRYQHDGFGLWALISKEDGCFIGQCGITYQNIDGETLPEIGFHVNKRYWGKGFATEAAVACLDYGFERLGFDEMFIYTAESNQPAMQVAKKLGMVERKRYTKSFRGHAIPMVVFSKPKS